MIFSLFQNFLVLGILGPPYCGIGATIGIGREMLCLPYAGFFLCVPSLTDLINNKAVCRTAPATPGLLIIKVTKLLQTILP